MKTKLILTSFVIFAAFIGCSENMNITNPENETYNENGQLNKSSDNKEVTEIWKLEELSVYASNEGIVENKAVYSNPPFSMISSYLVTFDAYTDADKIINGYIPVAEVTKDGEDILNGPVFPNQNGEETSHFEIKLNNVRFNNLEFYIALIQGDAVPSNPNESVCSLRLSNIKIYRIE